MAIILALLLTLAALSMPDSTVAAEGSARSPVADPHLQAQVSVRPDRVTPVDLMRVVRRSSGVAFVENYSSIPRRAAPSRSSVMLQGCFDDRPLVVSVGGVRAGALMEAVATATGGQWRRVGPTWVLVDLPGLESFVVAPPEINQDRILKGESSVLRQLTPGQIGALTAGKTLTARDLTLLQRRVLIDALRCSYAAGMEMDPACLNLDGVAIRIHEIRSDPGASPGSYEVALYLRELDGGSRDPLSIELRGLGIDPGLVRSATPAGDINFPPPSLPNATPARPRGQGELLNGDEQLRSPFRAGGLPANVAALTLGQNAGVSLVMGGMLQTRRLWDREKPTVSSTMSAIASVSGGVWQKSDGIYALAPDPAVERVASLIPAHRSLWLRQALLAVRRGLSAKQLARLESEGKLEGHTLSVRLRDYLRWAAAAAFVIDENVSAEALDPNGVTLKWEKSSPASKRPVLHFLVPSRAGEERPIGAIPL